MKEQKVLYAEEQVEEPTPLLTEEPGATPADGPGDDEHATPNRDAGWAVVEETQPEAAESEAPVDQPAGEAAPEVGRNGQHVSDAVVIEHPLYQRALAHLQQAEWADALKLLQQLQEQYPGNPEIQTLLEEAEVKASLGAYRPGLRERLNILRSPRVRRVAQFALVLLVLLGVGWLYTQQIQPAIAARRQQAEKVALLQSAQQALQAGNYDLAEEQFEELLARYPDLKEAQEGLQAVRTVRDLAARYEKAKALAEAGKWEEALPLLRSIAAERPGYRNVSVLIAQGEHALKVAQTFEKAQAAYESGDWAAAIEGYEAVRAEDVNYQRDVVQERLFESYLRQADALAAASDPESLREALNLYNRALQLRPRDPRAQAQRNMLQAYLRAMRAVEQSDWEEVVYQLSDIVQNQPDFAGGQAAQWLVKAYLELGKEAFDQGDVKGAQTYYDQALAIAQQVGPEMAGLVVETRLEMARAAEEAGDFDAALAHYQAVFDMLREAPSADELLASIGRPTSLFDLRLQIGEDAAAMQDWRTAATMYRQALLEGPLAKGNEDQPLAQYYMRTGDAAFEQGDYKAAFEAYRQAVEAIRTGQKVLVYTVVAGDTVSALAARFGSTVEAIAEMNNLENPGLIYVGQKLLIPILQPGAGEENVSNTVNTP